MVLSVGMIHTVLSLHHVGQFEGWCFFGSVFNRKYKVLKLKRYCCFQAPRSSVQERPPRLNVYAHSLHKGKAEVRICGKQKPICAQCQKKTGQWWRTAEIQLMISLKFKGRSFVLLNIVLLLPFLAVRECKWHTRRVWLINTPRSALMCARWQMDQPTGEKKKSHSMKESRMKKVDDLKRPCTFVIADFCLWFLSAKQPQQTFITWFSYFLSVYVATLEDSSASKSRRTGHACFYVQIIGRGWRSGP